MNELQIIDKREVLGNDFTIYGDVDCPLFKADEVAKWIEHTNVSVMLNNVDEQEKQMVNVGTLNNAYSAWFLTEDGLYEVLMQSRKPIAKEFKKQVKEILRSIRRHGAYMTPAALEEAIVNPDTMIKILTALKEEQDKAKALQTVNSELSVKNAIMAPKADYFDELVDRHLLTNFRDTAKELEVKEKDFIGYLISKKYIYRDQKGKLQPYADKNNGLFELKECFNEKTQWSGTQTLITPKGRETFRLLMKGK